MRELFQIIGIFFISFCSLNAQTVSLQGFVFEANNRGYLHQAKATFYDNSSNAIKQTVYTDVNGVFNAELPVGVEYRLAIEKDLFVKNESIISTIGKQAGEKIFTKIEMTRKPGYIFDVTVANKRKEGQEVVDAVQGALIEVYNNTKEEEALVLKDYAYPSFKTTFEQGNHYTVMIRKKGYFNKRMEAYVNVEGCILCFEGVGTVQPGVSDVMTEGLQMGTLLANVELEPIELNKAIKIENIYYDYNKSEIRDDAAKELDKLIGVLKDNPALIVELGSHTDSRGRDSYNLKLSEKRAKAAVKYITAMSNVDNKRITAKGYGETQLVNKCKNGVKCSDRKHQQNRRTELKIVGISDVDVYSDKSLAAIMEEEKFERMLAEVQNSEVVKVEAGQELPPEIKNHKIPEQTEVKVDERPAVVPDMPVVKVEEMPSPTTTTVPEETIKETMPAETITEPSTATSEPTTPKVEDIRKSKPVQPSRRIGKSEPVSPSSTNDGSEEFDGNGSKIIAEKELNVTPTVGKTVSLPPNYTGYRIEFFASPYELPSSHEIFQRHGEITHEMKKDGSYAYLLGDFGEWRDANKFLNSIMLSQYPNAKVIRYKKGNRLRS